MTVKEYSYIFLWFSTPSKCNFLTAICTAASWSTPIKRLVYPLGINGAVIPEGSAIELKYGMYGAAVVEDGPGLKSCFTA